MKKTAIIFLASIAAVGLFLLLIHHRSSQRSDCSHRDITALERQLDADMVPVAGGDFDMGTDSLRDAERPVHHVVVDSFYISRYETTISLFGSFICATGYVTDAERDGKGSVVFVRGGFDVRKHVTWQCDEQGMPRSAGDSSYPVLHVSWYDADTFCRWLSAATGRHYRLPTESEWEYAARGGRDSHGYLYSGSDDPAAVAWYGPDAGMRIHPVGLKQSNELGLYDMSGNVWEWCSDLYTSYAPQDTVIRARERISRGGCYLSGISDTLNSKNECRVAFRGKDDAGVSACDGTFRIARDIHGGRSK